MTKQNDHDLLVRIDERVGAVITRIDKHSEQIKDLYKENECRKDWQQTADTKIKTYSAVATFIGGAIVFIADRIINWIAKK